MSDVSLTSFPTQIVVTCEFCDGTNHVKWFCKSCAASICNVCKTSHLKITAFKNHVIVPRTNDVMRLYGPSKIAEQCSIHPQKEISTYCKVCEVPCCATCLVQKHQRHEMLSIENAYLSAEKRLNENAKKLEIDIMPTFDKMTDDVEKNRSEQRKKINGVRDEVNAFRIKMKQAIDISCDNLLKTLDQNEVEFDYLIKKIDAQKRKVRYLIKEIEEIIQRGDLSMKNYSPPSSRTLIPKVRTPKLMIPVFCPGRDILTTVRDRIGTIKWTEGTSDQKETSSPNTIFDPLMINISKVGSFRSTIKVTSITTTSNNTAWVMCDVSETMYLHDSSDKVFRSIKVKGSKGINGMVIRRSGEMVVTCSDSKVRRVTGIGVVSTLIDSSPFKPTSICLTDREDVVVCMRGQDEKNHVAVYLHDTDRKLREIRGRDDKGKQRIINPYHVASNGKDLYVVNLNPDHVVCVDERSDVRWVYDAMESELTGSFNPRGISIDKYNNLLVSDINNNCIHYIDREGRLIQIILTRDHTGLSRPWGISVDSKTGHVWVGSGCLRDRCVAVSKYLQ